MSCEFIKVTEVKVFLGHLEWWAARSVAKAVGIVEKHTASLRALCSLGLETGAERTKLTKNCNALVQKFLGMGLFLYKQVAFF